MTRVLRDYQQKIVNDTKKCLNNNTSPSLITLSVGGGKSIIIAEILKWVEASGRKALCLTLNSTLIKQNYAAYLSQGGDAGIYCAALNSKDIAHNVIFASPHSVVAALKKDLPISYLQFNLIVVDECHNINQKDKNSMYMRIFNHYGYKAQLNSYKYRILGLTGTPYRDNNVSILGGNAFFQNAICDISSSYLIERGFLVKPKFVKSLLDSYDMDNINTNSLGKFENKDLTRAINAKPRLTQAIINEVIKVTSGRNGAFIFASTIKHAEECMQHLPQNMAKIITGDTPHGEREKILQGAREGSIKYLVNVATLLVGVDVPNFDVCAFLRPTESFLLFTQAIGRVLRLHPSKNDALILDYAGNVDRHADIDDLIINEALGKAAEDDDNYCVRCPKCSAMNKLTARRCIGKWGRGRCDYYFTFKECFKCLAPNDVTARSCRTCKQELIDPNLKLMAHIKWHQVKDMSATAKLTVYNDLMLSITYTTTQNIKVYEHHFLSSKRKIKIFFNDFLQKHAPDCPENPDLNQDSLRDIINAGMIKPHAIKYKKQNNFNVIYEKTFEKVHCG